MIHKIELPGGGGTGGAPGPFFPPGGGGLPGGGGRLGGPAPLLGGRAGVGLSPSEGRGIRGGAPDSSGEDIELP